jgi:putative membrane protein
MDDDLPSLREPVDTATSLAVARTVMAADRSLMAWVRTALSMISFGFTIYKVLQGFAAVSAKRGHLDSPRCMGLFLTAIGTFSMAMGTVEYVDTMKAKQAIGRYRVFRPAMLMAMIMSLTGLALFISISERLV